MIEQKIDEARKRAKEWADANYPLHECEENIHTIARDAYFAALLETIYRIYKIF